MKEKTAIAGGILIYVLITIALCTGRAEWFDDMVRFPVYALRDSAAAPVLKVVSVVLHYLVSWKVIVPVCIVLLLIKKTRIIYGIPVSAAALAVTMFNKTVKSIVMRPRPDDIVHLVSEGGWSYSSGHSITSMCLCVVLIWIVLRRYRQGAMKKTAAISLTVCISLVLVLTGPSRIFLGVHYPTDVLAGWAAGLAAAAATILIIKGRSPWSLERHVSGSSVEEDALR
ncbi:MAG: phosphatase PAP2 family protein [Firmicutes bacterium]|nr:phosphatase PAP2 family protein [Bacillota bacterium]MDY2920523.1 phosphatase PAP2 family protein [Lentihominibacter sp.]